MIKSENLGPHKRLFIFVEFFLYCLKVFTVSMYNLSSLVGLNTVGVEMDKHYSFIEKKF